jgi:hypothetical protein
MNKPYPGILLLLAIFVLYACQKEDSKDSTTYTYYEVGFTSTHPEWRDTAFIVRTSSQQRIREADAQLALPVEARKIVAGKLVAGSGGYNKNASHSFGWHFDEADWQLVDMTIEIYDGRPYTDVDQDLDYWLHTVKRYGSWG